MIRYALTCAKGHAFEAWFRNSAAYDKQAASKEVICPECGSADISKAPMAPGIAPSRKSAGHDQKVLEALRATRNEVLKDAEDVGDNFASEARKIHYKETAERGIYGRATDEEAKALNDEGVEFTRLPTLPEDHN